MKIKLVVETKTRPRLPLFRAEGVIVLFAVTFPFSVVRAASASSASAAEKKKPLVGEAELRHKPIPRPKALPWAKRDVSSEKKHTGAGPTETPNSDEPLAQLAKGGALRISCDGPIKLNEEILPTKPGEPKLVRRTISLSKNVSVRQTKAGLSVRGQVLRAVFLVRHAGTDKEEVEPECLEARGGVVYVNGPTRARGELITAEMKKNAAGDVLKDCLTVVGDGTGKVKAVLSSGANHIRAEKFVVDRRLDTFRAFGGTLLEYTLPPDKKAAGGTRAANDNGKDTASHNHGAGENLGGGLGELAVKGGDRITVRCDGEVAYEGAQGRVVFERNVLVKVNGDAIRLWADFLTLFLRQPEKAKPAATAGAGAVGLFAAGAPREISCLGRVDLAVPGQIVFCDHARLDLERKTAVLKTDEAGGYVDFYGREKTGTRLMRVRRRALFRFAASGLTLTGGRRKLSPYRGPLPRPRRLRHRLRGVEEK